MLTLVVLVEKALKKLKFVTFHTKSGRFKPLYTTLVVLVEKSFKKKVKIRNISY